MQTFNYSITILHNKGKVKVPLQAVSEDAAIHTVINFYPNCSILKVKNLGSSRQPLSVIAIPAQIPGMVNIFTKNRRRYVVGPFTHEELPEYCKANNYQLS